MTVGDAEDARVVIIIIMTVGDAEDARWWLSSMMMTVMMTMMSDGYDEDPYLYLFHIRFKSPVRPDWRFRGRVVIIIMMTVGDAEDAR